MDILAYIKRLIIEGQVAYTKKALDEMSADQLEEADVEESIVNATSFRLKRSRSKMRSRPYEKVFIIESFTHAGWLVYTNGVVRKHLEQDVFYVLISAKRSVRGN